MGAIQLTFFGSVAFVPTNPDQAPMTDGAASSVLAILPRAYSEDQINDANPPDRREFDPQNEKHADHHLILKLHPEHLGLSGADEIAIPVRPPSSNTDVHEISVQGLVSSGRVRYTGFATVAPVLKGTNSSLQPSAPSRNAASGSAALARMPLGPGWTLSVPNNQVDFGKTVFLQCPSGMGCSPQQAPTADRSFALAVLAECPTAGAVTLEVKNGSATVLSLPLRERSAGSPIAVKILHAPFSEIFGGNPHVHAMHHFKLFYLQAAAVQRPYCYPILDHTALPSPRTDPFCTPLAQFLPV